MTRAAGKTRIVMKFGGTSVADLERIRRSPPGQREVEAGHQVAVVVSAMAGKTNRAGRLDRRRRRRARPAASDDEYDVVVASGEQVTAGLLAMTLRNMGVNARSWLGWQIPIIDRRRPRPRPHRRHRARKAGRRAWTRARSP